MMNNILRCLELLNLLSYFLLLEPAEGSHYTVK